MALSYLIVFIFFVVAVDAMSWRTKEAQRDFLVDSIGRSVSDGWDDIETCKDDHPKCDSMAKLCSSFKIVRMKCKDKCGLCRVPGVPVCSISKHGCCWDNSTVAQGPNFEGCEECADKYSECKDLATECNNPQRPNIKLMCPVTCKVCKQCLDNPHQADVCKLYKKYKFCELSPDLMQRICPKTCGFCK